MSEQMPESVTETEIDLNRLPLPLDRERPVRPPLVSRAVWISVAATAAIIGVIVLIVVLAQSSSAVAVPDVTNVPLGTARARLEQVGLELAVSERRFSTEPTNLVLEQEPAAGGELRRGESVAVVISAGSEEFPMPDVIGDGLALAQGTLESRGLVVRTEAVPSDLPSDTVLGSTPSPGQPVRTGDIVSLQIAAPGGSGNVLKPFQLEGTVFVIDPTESSFGGTDVSLEVGRRLRSLLEASGATVVMTRSSTTSAVVDVATRARAAAEASATAAIGLDVASAGAAGRIVTSPSAGQPSVVGASTRLAQSITTQLSSFAPPAVTRKVAGDDVLGPAGAPWVRIRLGSTVARPDQNSFGDPNWADSVARAIYLSIGEQFALAPTVP